MPIKSRLFASVAAPVLSLPLMIQPVSALPLGLDVAPVATASPGVIRVQEQIIPEDGQPGQGREKPKREKAQSDGERPQRRGEQADQSGGEQPPKRRQQQDAGQAEEQQPSRQREQAEQPESQRPQRREQQADQDGGEQPPKRRQQQAEEVQPQQQQSAEPAAKPRAPKPDAQQAEQPQQQAEQPRRKPEKPAEADGAQPLTPEKADKACDAPAGKPRPPKQDAQQAGQPEPQAEQPRSKPPKPAQADGGQPTKPARQQNAEQAPDGKSPSAADNGQQAEQPQPAVKPSRQQADEGQPGQPADQPRQADQSKPPLKPGQPKADQAQQEPIQPGKPPANQQAGQGADQQPDGAAAPMPPQTAKTPEQVERAKEIAKDPAAAKPGEQAVLPVENGAAVLDSAKQQNRRPSGDGRDRPRQQGQFDPQAGQQAARPPRNAVPDQPPGPPPRSDADAQGPGITRQQEQQAVRDADQERGKRLDKRPKFERPNGWEVLGAAALGAAVGYAVGQGQNQGNQAPPPPGYGDRDDGRVFMRIDDQEVIRHDDSRRFYDDRRPPQYDELSEGRVREVIVREDGTRIVTIRNRYGEIVQRSRIARGGEEYVLYYAPQLVNEQRGPDYVWRDPGDDLPPMRLQVPLDDYIADTSAEPDRDYYRFLEKPPVERVERVYSLDEVRYSARLRDKVRRIDLDTITFDTGSATISMNQAGTLRNVADGIKQVLDRDPSETFLIEGHTDAVGSDQNNLVLSDERAESVARVLTDVYGIPPENMATQGYGEQFLKVQTAGANQENRRVTIRRITPLVKPVASNR